MWAQIEELVTHGKLANNAASLSWVPSFSPVPTCRPGFNSSCALAF